MDITEKEKGSDLLPLLSYSKEETYTKGLIGKKYLFEMTLPQPGHSSLPSK